MKIFKKIIDKINRICYQDYSFFIILIIVLLIFLAMKKFFAYLVLAIALILAAVSLVSCNNKPQAEEKKVEKQHLIGDFFAFKGEVVSLDNAAPKMQYGILKGDSVILAPQYDKIVWDKGFDGFRCYTGTKNFTIADTQGKVLRFGAYAKVTRENDGEFYYFYDEDGKIAVYSKQAGRSWGMYDEVVIDKTFLFCREGKDWGVISFNQKLYLNKDYNNIYVVNFKNENDYSVITCKNGEWEMFDQDQKYYDASSAELKRMCNKPAKGKAVGVLNINF